MSSPERKPFFKPFRRTTPTLPVIDSLYEFRTTTHSLEEVVTPLALKYRGVEIRILEVTKVETRYLKEYFVVVQFKLGDKLTKPITISCTDIDDFVRKLRVEVIRLRIFAKYIPDTFSQL